MHKTKVKSLHEVMLPLWERCEELRLKGLKRKEGERHRQFEGYQIDHWMYDYRYLNETGTELICEAWMSRWLGNHAARFCTEEQDGGWAVSITITNTYHAVTLWHALALACHAVLDEKERKQDA